MELVALRISSGKESTLGQMYVNGQPECFILEDQYQEIKVQGKTRIPEGKYKIALRKVMSPATENYRKKYPWFTYHLHIQNVPNFEYVYIHVGNTDDHTDGCLLVGDSISTNQHGNKGFQGNSKAAYERFYKKVHKALSEDEEVTIDVRTYKP